MIALMQIDLPEPVVPAISRCGILLKSVMTGRPSKLRPSARGSTPRTRSHSRDSSSSRSVTTRGVGLGTSTPTAALPGIAATVRQCRRWASSRKT